MEAANGASGWRISRRVFLRSAAALAGLPLKGAQEGGLRFGVVTDVHYADRPPSGTRYYRLGIGKLRAVVDLMNAQRVDFLIELGDFKDQDEQPSEARTIEYLRAIETVFQSFGGARYHVLGNHDMDSISKMQFQAVVSNTGVPRHRTYYSFDRGGFHFVVLDANFRRDGVPYEKGNYDYKDTNVSAEQIDWLRADLAGAQGPCVVFVHQRLDESGEAPPVGNRTVVREILQGSGKVGLVMQGHVHAGGYQQIGGIHYYTQVASVEGDKAGDATCTIVRLQPGGGIEITGYERAVSRTL